MDGKEELLPSLRPSIYLNPYFNPPSFATPCLSPFNSQTSPIHKSSSLSEARSLSFSFQEPRFRVFISVAPTLTPNQTSHTPSPKSNITSISRTPQSKHRLNLNNPSKPSPNPDSYPPRSQSKPISALKISSDHKSLMVRTDIGYREFLLDEISLSEEDDLDGFYRKFVESCTSLWVRSCIPREVVDKHNLHLPKILVLVDEINRQWEAEVRHWDDGRIRMSQGWKPFCRVNNIRLEDRCLCEFIQGKGQLEPSLKMRILREGSWLPQEA